MPDKKVNQLDEATSISETDFFMFANPGTGKMKRTTTLVIKNFINPNAPESGTFTSSATISIADGLIVTLLTLKSAAAQTLLIGTTVGGNELVGDIYPDGVVLTPNITTLIPLYFAADGAATIRISGAISATTFKIVKA